MANQYMSADDFALALWREQLERGLGEPGEVADPDRLGDWWANRVIDRALYERAAAGDVAAIARVRREAGLPPIV